MVLTDCLSKGRHVMKQTAPPGASRFLGNEFNPFLFAFIGTDRSGGQLSVVSALARLDLDAWAEAASLARLPRDVAASKLSVLLRKYTEIPRIVQDSGAIATRLIALLPDRAPARTLVISSSRRMAAQASALVFGILVTMALLLGLQYFNHAAHIAPHATPATPPAAATSAPAAGTSR